MRRSFGQGAGGAIGGGGGMMRTVHRAARAATGGRGSSQEPFSHSNTNHNSSTNCNSPTSGPSYNPNTLSFSSVNHPNWANLTSPISSSEEYDSLNGFEDDIIFGTVPSMDEVHHAVSSLQQVLGLPTDSHESECELYWIEPSRNMLQSRGSESVYDAFRLLQTDPSVKRMVISLSSDKSVWDAVMNNEAVRELRDSVYEASKSISGSSGKVESSDGSIPVPNVLHGIFIDTKTKVMEIVEKITEMVNKLFQPSRNEKAKGEGAATELFEKKLTSSFYLSVMVLLIIVVGRVSQTCRSS